MLFEFPPRVPGSSLKRRRDSCRKINKNGGLVWFELFGIEIDRYAGDMSRQGYWILPKDGGVNCASGQVTTGRRGMRSIAIIQIDTRICLPHSRPGQANGRHQRVSRSGSANVCVIQRRLIHRCGPASPRKIKNGRGVMFADFVGPAFGIRTKYLVSSDSRLTFEVKVNSQRALVLQDDKIPSLRVQRLMRGRTLPMILKRLSSGRYHTRFHSALMSSLRQL